MTAGGAHRLVLIVEDNEACAVTLQIALEALPGVEVRMVTDGPAALDFLNRFPQTAAVITDLQLPGMNGLDLLARLRSDPRFHAIPAVIVSGDSDPMVPARALAAGAHAFFIKPYSPLEVRRKLEQLITS